MDPSFIIIIALAFGAMWLMSSRTRKQQRAAGDFRANLEVGNEVMTGSGLFGTIVDIDGDTITLESMPGNESRWIRAAIAKLVVPPVLDEADEGDEAEDDDEDYLDDDDEADYDDSELAEDVDDDLDAETPDGDLLEVEASDADTAARPSDARTTDDDDVIVVPDDLSSLSDPRKDDDPDKL